MVDYSFKIPAHHAVNNFTNQRANDFQQNMSKGIPCHVTKIEKDIVTVAFDTQGAWQLPTMKMPTAFSPYARDATQVGDHGYASSGDYYLGGNSGVGGGIADYAPRGNMTPLVFHPMSRTQNQNRDYDKYTMTGGKNGIQMWQGPAPAQNQQQQPQQQQNQQTQSSSTPSTLSLRGLARNYSHGRKITTHFVRGRGFSAARGAPRATNGTTGSNGSSSSGTSSNGTSGGSSSQPSGTSFTIDNKGVYTLDGTKKYRMTVQQSNQKTTVEAPTAGMVYVGGPGVQSQLYGPILTPMGPAVNAMAKIQKQDEDVPSQAPQQSGQSGQSSQ